MYSEFYLSTESVLQLNERVHYKVSGHAGVSYAEYRSVGDYYIGQSQSNVFTESSSKSAHSTRTTNSSITNAHQYPNTDLSNDFASKLHKYVVCVSAVNYRYLLKYQPVARCRRRRNGQTQ